MIIPRLSPQSSVAYLTETPKDLNIYRNAIGPSVATWPCLFLVQLISVDPKKHRTPETDLRVTWSWVWSESKYTEVLIGRPPRIRESLVYISQRSGILLYLVFNVSTLATDLLYILWRNNNIFTSSSNNLQITKYLLQPTEISLSWGRQETVKRG